MKGPGLKKLTRTPQGAHSIAIDRVRLRRAAFEAPYADTFGPGWYAAIVPMLMMLPPPPSRITGATCWLIRSGPSRLTENTLRQYSRVIWLGGIGAGLMPALLTSTSIRPKWPTT